MGVVEEAHNVKVIGTGTQATIVLGHGFGTDQSVWKHLVPHLLEDYRIVLYDNMGAGTTNPDYFDFDRYSTLEGFSFDLIAILEDLQIESCIFVGHSVSAMVGLLASLNRPDLFSKIVMISASPRYVNDVDYQGGFEQDDLNQLFEAMRSNYKAWCLGFAPLAVGGDLDSVAVQEFSRTLFNMRPDIALSVAQTIFQSDMRQILPFVAVPCHILQSVKDLAVPVAVSEYLHTNLGCESVFFFFFFFILGVRGLFRDPTIPRRGPRGPLLRQFVTVAKCTLEPRAVDSQRSALSPLGQEDLVFFFLFSLSETRILKKIRDSDPDKKLLKAPTVGDSVPLPCIVNKEGGGEPEKINKMRRQFFEKIRVHERRTYLQKKEPVVREKGIRESSKKNRTGCNNKSVHCCPMGGSLQRTQTLPSYIGREDEFQDQESEDSRMGFLIREAIASSSSGFTPTKQNIPKSSSIPRPKPPRHSRSEEAIQEMVTKSQKNSSLKTLRKTLSSVDTKELLMLKELEVIESEKNQEKDEEEQRRVPRAAVKSRSAAVVGQPIPVWVPKKSRRDMKAQLRFWARTVASNVRQEC